MRTRTKLMAGFNASVLVGGALVLLAGAAPASAHTPAVAATCSELTVSLENYTPDAGNAAPNTILVTLDGKQIASETFGATFNATYTFDGTTVGHEYIIEVDAIGTEYDRTFTGTTEVCPAPPAEPPVVVPPVDPPVVVPPVEPPVVVPPVDPPVVVPPVEPPVVVPPAEPPVVVPPVEPPVVVPPVEPPVVVPPVEPPVVVPPTVVPPVTTTPPVEPPVTTAPPVEPPVTTTPPDVELPSTGAETAWALPLAGALLLGGIALMFVRRSRKA